MSNDAYRLRDVPVLGKALQFYDDLKQPVDNRFWEGQPVLSDLSDEERLEMMGTMLPVDSGGLAGMLKKAPAILKSSWSPKSSKVFDMEGLDDISRFPSVPQAEIDRYVPARGVPEGVAKSGSVANKKRIANVLEDGIDKGGLSWYNLRPLRDEYVSKFGETEGVARFEKFSDLAAATSPRSTVKANIKRASMFQKMAEDGDDITKALNTSEVGEGLRMPSGYGHLAHKNHRGIITDAMSDVGLSGAKKFGRPKISSFAENLKGNIAPVTVDTHNKKLLTLPYNLPETVANTEYGFLERLNKDMAKRHGIAPAQAQSATWVGGSNVTGVDDARPFMELMDERIMETARQLNISPRKALDMFLGGKTALYSAAPAVGLAGVLADQEEYSEGE